MSVQANPITEIIIRSLVSVLCCLAVGSIFYQSLIFNYHAGAFSVPMFGFIGSVFFYSLRVNIKNAFAVLLVLFVMDSALITHATKLTFLLRDLFYIGALSAAIFIFFKYFYNKNEKERWLEPLILSTLVAVFILGAAFLSLIIFNALRAISLPWIYNIAKLYFLIGLGIGIGITVTEEPYSRRILQYFKPVNK
jgi:hypothetical protein